MIADGGMPARRYPGANVAEATAMARALAAQQARVTEDMAGRLVALERDGKDKIGGWRLWKIGGKALSL